MSIIYCYSVQNVTKTHFHVKISVSYGGMCLGALYVFNRERCCAWLFLRGN